MMLAFLLGLALGVSIGFLLWAAPERFDTKWLAGRIVNAWELGYRHGYRDAVAKRPSRRFASPSESESQPPR
jgi:hypothetical protein